MRKTDYINLKHRLCRFIKVTSLAIIGLFCFAASVFAQEDEFPAPRGYINDFANLVEPSDYQKLNALLTALEQKTTAEIVVVTLKTTKPYDIQDYSVRLFEKWKIGKAGKDNGVLLLVAVEDKKVWITTGYGLEGAIPDAKASKIYRHIIVPYFKKNEFSKGVVAGCVALVNLTSREYNVSIEDLAELNKQYVKPIQKSPVSSIIESLFTLLFFVLIFGFRFGLFSFLLLGSGRRRGGYWYGGGLSGTSGGFSGGFGGFGGGFTGGGGAGGGW